MNSDQIWEHNRVLRSVKSLRLWGQNPRIDPENKPVKIIDFVEEFTSTKAKKEDFLNLVESIATKNFRYFDPVVVWKAEQNSKYYVAEGNRRVLALKLLLDPEKAPLSIRRRIIKLSEGFDSDNHKKIEVILAPTFEDAQWYISQRHVPDPLLRRWDREQHLRWVMTLYEKYHNLEEIQEHISLTQSELESIKYTLELKKLISHTEGILSEDEIDNALSLKFPISTFERLFSNSLTKEFFNITFEEDTLIIGAERSSFLNSFSEVIKRMLLPRGNEDRIYSRNINSSNQIEELLNNLPPVEHSQVTWGPDDEVPADSGQEDGSTDSEEEPEPPPDMRYAKNNPKRTKLIAWCYTLKTDHPRLEDMFDELQRIPYTYKNSIAASIRIFLDLTINIYITNNGLEEEIKRSAKNNMPFLSLRTRINFVLNKLPKKSNARIVLNQLLNDENLYSLRVLNAYVHNNDSHFLNKIYLNNFWDFLMPFFQQVLDIREESV
jgi:hypothetical protein